MVNQEHYALSDKAQKYQQEIADLKNRLSRIEASILYRQLLKFQKIIDWLFLKTVILYKPYNKFLKIKHNNFLQKNDAMLQNSTEANHNKSQFIPTLKSTHESLETFLLKFPNHDEPKVSIVIPVWNQAHFTQQCLHSIWKNTDIPYEVIVINNGSSDETPTLLSKISNITLVANQENMGWIAGCNQGAQRAKGEYVLFLNNDTIVTPRWLSSMAELLDIDSKCGAVGAKLISFDGTLQEAGATFSKETGASFTNSMFGRGDLPEKQAYSVIREVDYCAGACFMVRKKLFTDLGGFDIHYSPGYYEECDFCIKIREKGFRVLYQPNAQIYHNEKTSISEKEANKILRKNEAYFLKRWPLLNKTVSSYGSYIVASHNSGKILQKSPHPLVSVVIPVYNGAKTLAMCLNAVATQLYPYYELIIVNNNSTDGTQQIIDAFKSQYPFIRCIFEPMRGRGKARNTGILESRGEIIAMTDSDCIVPRDWLWLLVAHLRFGNDKIVMGSEYSVIDNYWSRNIQKGNALFLAEYVRGDYINYLDSKNFAAEIDIFRETLFNNQIKNCEDFEFSLRLRGKLKIRYVPTIKVGHFHKTSFLSWIRIAINRAYWTKKIYNGRNDQGALIDEAVFKNIRQGDLIRFLYSVVCELENISIGEAYFILVTGLAWRCGTVIAGKQPVR